MNLPTGVRFVFALTLKRRTWSVSLEQGILDRRTIVYDNARLFCAGFQPLHRNSDLEAGFMGDVADVAVYKLGVRVVRIDAKAIVFYNDEAEEVLFDAAAAARLETPDEEVEAEGGAEDLNAQETDSDENLASDLESEAEGEEEDELDAAEAGIEGDIDAPPMPAAAHGAHIVLLVLGGD